MLRIKREDIQSRRACKQKLWLMALSVVLLGKARVKNQLLGVGHVAY